MIALKRVVAPVIEMSGRLHRFEDEDLIPAPDPARISAMSTTTRCGSTR